MDPKLDQFCKILIRTGSLKFGTFKLASGLLSSYYVDLRLIPSNPEAFEKTIAMYVSVLKPSIVKRSQRLAGVPTAGVAYATGVALTLAKPLLFVRKGDGQERRIEGLLQPGDRVVILDGIASTGKKLIEAADAVRAEGGIVDDAVVLLDRQQGAVENLRRANVRLHAFTGMRRIAEKLLNLGTIDQDQYKQIVGKIAV